MGKTIFVAVVFALLSTAFIDAHPGRLDSKGGHYNRKTGEYHYHNGGQSPIKSIVNKYTHDVSPKTKNQNNSFAPPKKIDASTPVNTPKQPATPEPKTKRYTIYHSSNSPYVNEIEESKQLKSAFIVHDKIKNITYFPGHCSIALQDWNFNLIVITKGQLKINVGDVIEVICFYCSGVISNKDTGDKIPSYLAIKIDKIIGGYVSGISTEFIIGRIENITQAHKENISNPNSTVRIQYKGKSISIEYVLADLDKFIKNLNKEVVLELYSFNGNFFLKDIHDESIFQKLLGKKPVNKRKDEAVTIDDTLTTEKKEISIGHVSYDRSKLTEVIRKKLNTLNTQQRVISLLISVTNLDNKDVSIDEFLTVVARHNERTYTGGNFAYTATDGLEASKIIKPLESTNIIVFISIPNGVNTTEEKPIYLELIVDGEKHNIIGEDGAPLMLKKIEE